jgi:hypothetical protein
MKMAVIYISSTYEDLINERKAAAQAVKYLGHSVIAMENYVASDERPLDKCLKDVRSCNVYIGIFAWRYGYIPEGYKKSISHLEYEAAKKEGTRRLIFLLHENAMWPGSKFSKGKERDRIDRFRDELQKERLASFFYNSDRLSTLVIAALSKLFPPIPPTSYLKKSRLASIVSKMCDRSHQLKDFKVFFLQKATDCPIRPQFYFLHGDELEGHESFLKRLIKTYLKEYVEKKYGKDYAAIYTEEVSWPREGNMEERKKLLWFNLINEFNKGGENNDFNANVNTFVRFPCFYKHPLVIIKHDIYDSKWDKQTEQLITWYIKDYWSDIKYHANSDGNIPLFLIFFKVKYKHPKKKGLKQNIFKWKYNTKERIRKQLQYIYKSSDEHCPCQLIKELSPIAFEDLLEWFNKYGNYGIYEHEANRIEKAESIFRETRSMAKIEEKLHEILIECQREETIW